MANFIGAIEHFNPYIQQIPTEAYTKVGMFKQQQYSTGIEKVQETIDNIMGLDVANEGGREYLRARVNELTSSLNKYSQVDFSNPNNVTQLRSLAKPLYQDENILNDVINTGVYRKWAKDAGEAYKGNKMEAGQYARETSDASAWLKSKAAGAEYTGRSTPNLATKKDLVDRIIKAKKEGMEKSEFTRDYGLDTDKAYYVSSTRKHYSEAEFNNFVTQSVMTSKDREILQNEHWYENQGVPAEALQREDLNLYQSKINNNKREIDRLSKLAPLAIGDDKVEYENAISELQTYNKDLSDGKMKHLQELDLNNSESRDIFHRDLAESRFIGSLDVLRDRVEKDEYKENRVWFDNNKAALDAAAASSKAASDAAASTKKAPGTDAPPNEVGVFTPVNPDAPKTQLSLNTVQRGYQIMNDNITESMNGLIAKLKENGVNVDEFIDHYEQLQVGSKAGAAKNVPIFKPGMKDKFYNMVAGLNYAYTKEATDGHMDNKSFRTYLKQSVLGYDDTDVNSKFTLADKNVSDALNSLKGTSALLPKLEGLFADKGVVSALAKLDKDLKYKKDMGNVYREALIKSRALTTQEIKDLKNIDDDKLLSNTYLFNKKEEAARYAKYKQKALYSYRKDPDGTYSIYQNIFNDPDDKIVTGSHDYSILPEALLKGAKQELVDSRRLSGGFKTLSEVGKAFKEEGQLSVKSVISNESMKRAEEYVKETYSYVQENFNSTVQNLKSDKPAYAAVQDALSMYMNSSLLQASPEDIKINGVNDVSKLSGINNIEVQGATISNTEDIFNPNPMYSVTFKATVPDGDKFKEVSLSGKVSVRSMLATNPNYKTSQYAKYFAPGLYAQEDAFARIKASINPLEGSQASYANRGSISPVFQRTNQKGQLEHVTDDLDNGQFNSGNETQWETLPIERDGKQTMVSYQIVSLGQDTDLGNQKTKDGQAYEKGAYYIKLKMATSSGQPKVMFFKDENKKSMRFNSASYAHYALKDLIFNNPEIRMEDVDSKGTVNYLTVNTNTVRGIFNNQLTYNGYPNIEVIKFKDAFGKEQEKQQVKADGLQFAR